MIEEDRGANLSFKTYCCIDLLGNEEILQDIDNLGKLSAIAQNLKVPITSRDKLTSEHHIVLAMENGHLKGYLKYGSKKLYFYRKNGSVVCKESVMCVLDFYVVSESQRQGIGHKLFESFLSMVKIDPALCAYDRPSPKLYGFLAKYYSLKALDLQPNNYAITGALLS